MNRPLAFWLVATLAACSRNEASSSDPCAGAPAGEVSVQGAWVRPAAVGRTSSALYATICNRTGAPEALLSVTVPGVATVELHETTRTPEGAVSMAKIDRLDIPPEGAALAPGGAHAMLIGLSGSIEEGSTKTVVFNFENAPPVEAGALARRGADSSEHEHSH